jgi:hypothetical protein
MVVLAQGRLWQGQRGDETLDMQMSPVMPKSAFGNQQTDFGPLGDEDLRNFHP